MRVCSVRVACLDGYPGDECHCTIDHGHSGKHFCQHGFWFELKKKAAAITAVAARRLDAQGIDG
jgi:hypothetical protein